MSKPSNWQSAMLEELSERDVREKANYYMYETFSKLADRAVLAETNLSGSLSRSDESGIVKKLRLELDGLYNFQRTAKSRIETLEADSRKQQDYITRIVPEFEKMKLEKQKAEAGYRNRAEEYRERKKSMQALQDEILTYQIQLNIAEDRINKLEQENKELVIRWMERVSREAEKLNDANAFLESVGRTRDRARTANQNNESNSLSTSLHSDG